MKYLLIALSLFGAANAQTVDELRDYISKSDLQHKEIILKQALLETGHLKCTDCSMDHNNLFGWYYKKKYLEFDTWQASVDYYIWWQGKYYKGGDYFVFLKKKVFAIDPKYKSKVLGIKLVY